MNTNLFFAAVRVNKPARNVQQLSSDSRSIFFAIFSNSIEEESEAKADEAGVLRRGART